MKLATILLSAIVLFGQPTATQKFSGIWEARFKGDVFCVLKIQTGDKLGGTMSSVDINVDEDGNLQSAQAKDTEFPILRPSIESDKLIFEWTDNPDEAPLKLELKITGEKEAQLRIVEPPEGVKIKPFMFTKRG